MRCESPRKLCLFIFRSANIGESGREKVGCTSWTFTSQTHNGNNIGLPQGSYYSNCFLEYSSSAGAISSHAKWYPNATSNFSLNSIGDSGVGHALRSQMNKDPYQNAPKILIIPGCAPDLGVPQKRNFRSGSPRTVTCAPWKNLSNLPYL